MRFLVDAQLPPALARWLRDAGHESEHVGDVGLLNARDHEIRQFVLQNHFVLLTKDEDFAIRSTSDNEAVKPIVVWLRVGNTSNRTLRSWIERRLPTMLALIEKNDKLIEVV